jgi:hypothetical protein
MRREEKGGEREGQWDTKGDKRDKKHKREREGKGKRRGTRRIRRARRTRRWTGESMRTTRQKRSMSPKRNGRPTMPNTDKTQSARWWRRTNDQDNDEVRWWDWDPMLLDGGPATSQESPSIQRGLEDSDQRREGKINLSREKKKKDDDIDRRWK